jgi:energy-coupling factor transport system ATP-binding protein
MLDAAGRSELLETLKLLHKEHGLTIILISHYMEDVIEADRLVVLDRGEIYLTGAPWEVFNAADRLACIGMEPPDAVQIAQRLRRDGHAIDSGVVTVQQLVECLCPS